MRVSVNCSDASCWEVVDQETDRVLHDVAWADDTTQEYVQRMRDEQGAYILDRGVPMYRHVSNRRIALRRKVEEE